MTSERQRVVMVIGGAGAIGGEVSSRLAAVGDRVVVVDVNETAVASRCSLIGPTAVPMVANVVEEEQIERAFDTVESEIGVIDILVFCAGGTAVGGKPTAFWETGTQQWDEAIDLNVRSAFLALRGFLRRRAEKPSVAGRAVLIGSIAGQVAHSHSGVGYASGKAALQSVVRQAASEAGRLQVTVNIVAPGPIDTPALRAGVAPAVLDMVAGAGPIARLGTPTDIAAAIEFLASDEAGYITGATIDVNGGRRMQ